jgi:hypothetical protein
MPPVVHRLADGHINNSQDIERLKRDPALQTHAAQISPSHGFRTNGANDRRNVHDRRVEERKKSLVPPG